MSSKFLRTYDLRFLKFFWDADFILFRCFSSVDAGELARNLDAFVDLTLAVLRRSDRLIAKGDVLGLSLWSCA